MKNLVLRVWHSWCEFWFRPGDTLGLGLFRAAYGTSVLVMYSIRQLDLEFLYTDKGIVQSEWAAKLLPEFNAPIWTWLPQSVTSVYLLHSTLLLALMFLAVGLFSRWAALLALVCHLAFMQRNISVAYGADMINSFWLAYLSLTDSDQSVSLRAWLSRQGVWRRPPLSAWRRSLTQVGVRLVQVQLCLIYGFTGMEKLKGPPWWNGTAIWDVLGNQQLMMFETSFMRNFPLLIGVMTFSTLFFEVYFPIMVWNRRLRLWVLLFGLGMHLAIGLLMGLVFFSMVMVSSYFVFLGREEIPFSDRLITT